MNVKGVVLVEGADDEHVVKALCGRHNLGEYHIRALDGVETLLQRLPVHLQGSDLSSLAIIVDANGNPAGRRDAIKHALERHGYENVVIELNSKPAIIHPPDEESLLPRVGVWIMPDNRHEGAIENFLEQMMPSDDALHAHASMVLNNLPERLFSDENRLKAHLHTWLAWQERPGRPYGQAITYGFLNSDTPLSLEFAEWFRELFELGEFRV